MAGVPVNLNDPKSTHVVVGSGPAGVACALALIQRGAKVLLLDAGVSLEATRAAAVAEMSAAAASAWTAKQISRIKEGTTANAKGIPLKRIYGSDFPYRESDEHLPADYDGVGLQPSLAKGGLSNVWGAALLPYADRDIADCPVRHPELAAHYSAVLEITGLSVRSDDLAQVFPLYRKDSAALDLSQQAKMLLARLEQNRERLARAGIEFGQARIAVRISNPRRSQPGCVYCGLCMYGCPYGHIYSSESTLHELEHHPDFTYRPNVIVTHMHELPDRVRIHGYNRVSRALFEIEANRVYLAAGAIPTTRILLRSRSLYDQTVWMKDSQYFLFPLASFKKAGDVARESLHTLSQLFLEIFDPAVSPRTVHLQVYSYNDLIGQAVRKTFGPLAGRLEGLARSLEQRLLVVQGSLHSEDSSRIGVTLTKGEAGRPYRFRFRAEANPQTRGVIRRVLRKLGGHAGALKAFPVFPMLQIAEPGRGFHSGGAFPMNAKPGAMHTDLLGRPFGWQRIHAIDATVLPAIPATTITFSVMANAHRIASESAELP